MKDIEPYAQNEREPIIDILRGWALLSVAIMNYSTIYNWNNHTKVMETNALIEKFKHFFELSFESKGWTLLAILFGYSFSILLKKIRNKSEHQNVFFAKRMLWLFVFGFTNSLFFGGDILTDYAFMGIILLFFKNLSNKSIAVIAISILILTPVLQAILGNYHLLFTPEYRDTFYELYNQNTFWGSIKANLFMRYQWMLRLSYSIVLHLIQLGCFLLGIAMHRTNFFLNKVGSNSSFLKKISILSLLVSVLIYLSQNKAEQNDWKINEYYNLYYPQVLSIMVCSTTLICQAYYAGYCKRVFLLLSFTGKMTLTNYIFQNMVSFALFVLIRPAWNWQWYIAVGIMVYTLQLFLSKWWLQNYNYGFFEWLWRCLSYQKIFPFSQSKRFL